MDLRHLRYFIAVAEELHFTRAARRLHIAQPPMSRQIRELEEELGVTLFNRTRRQVELTDAGQVFLIKARQVLRAAESAVLETQRAERGETGKLAVGFFEQTAYTLLPPILRAFNQRFPEVDVQLRWFPVIDQVEALEQGEVDIAFVRPVADLSAVSKRLLLTDGQRTHYLQHDVHIVSPRQQFRRIVLTWIGKLFQCVFCFIVVVAGPQEHPPALRGGFAAMPVQDTVLQNPLEQRRPFLIAAAAILFHQFKHGILHDIQGFGRLVRRQQRHAIGTALHTGKKGIEIQRYRAVGHVRLDPGFNCLILVFS